MSDPRVQPLSRRDRLRRFYVNWLPLALLLTAFANLAITPFVPEPGRPIRAQDEGSLTHLVHNESPSVDQRFGFYLELDEATDGGVLVVPPGSFVVPELADGFADFEVTEQDYDPTLPLPGTVDDPGPIGIVETEAGTVTYSIVSGEDDVWWLAYDDQGVVLVPESVLPVPGAGP